MSLKGHKHEKFMARIVTQTNLYGWLTLEIKPTNFKNLWLELGPYFLHVNWDFFVRELG